MGTMIKLLTGENVPQTGAVWKHPSVRVAYVAQHAFHHIEKHLDKSPVEYIQWRYANGEDKEALKKKTMELTEEEEAKLKKPITFEYRDEESGKTVKYTGTVDEFTGKRRQAKSKEFEYEVSWVGKSQEANMYISYTKLEKFG